MASGASFSVATTVFVSLAICAVISYGIFYYFKQRLSVIEQSQMEQARILQAIISRGVQQAQHLHAQHHAAVDAEAHPQSLQTHPVHKEIIITQNGLIEVSSDDSDDDDSDTDSYESSSSSSDSDNWSIGDEIHQPDSLHEAFQELQNANEKKHIHIESIETIDIDHNDHNDHHDQVDEADANQKKIISLNKSALTNDDDNDDDDDEDDDSSSSEDGNHQNQDQDQDQDQVPFELKIGYKSNQNQYQNPNPNKDASSKAMHLNYANMSVPALRQLAKERNLGGDDGDLQKLKKKDLVQLLTSNSI
jgi:hypothetical protein